MGIDAEAIADAGAALARQRGWDAVSLRSVAGQLGVTPMALYRHVEDSDALIALVVERIVGSTVVPGDTGDLQADLTSWARRFRADLAVVDGLAGWLLGRWFASPAVLERVEALLALVGRHGIAGEDAVKLTNAVFTYVLMRCEVERVVRSANAVRRTLRTSGGARTFPNLTALADHYTTAQFDVHFEFGLGALVAGALQSVQR